MTARSFSLLDVAVARWKSALFAMFLVFGASLASWVTRTPDIRDAIAASTAQMGLVLAGLSIGSIIGITVTGRLITSFGTSPVVLVAGSAVALGLAAVAAATATGSALLAGLGLALFGLGLGSCEVAINVDGSAVEHATDRTVLPTLHGCFSLGTFLGALAGMGFSAAALPVALHLAVAVAVVAATTAWAVRGIPRGRRTDAAQHRGSTRAMWRDRTVLLIGVVALGMAFAEGTANDWLPLIAVDGFGVSTATGSIAFALFALVMTIGRFCGAWVLGRVGRVLAVRATAGIAAIGVTLIVVAPNLAVGAIGVVLWGVGISLGFPVALSAAGDTPQDPAARVSAVATVGYLAFLAGPPLLGLLGESVGLRNAIGVVVIAILLAVACATATREQDQLARRD